MGFDVSLFHLSASAVQVASLINPQLIEHLGTHAGVGGRITFSDSAPLLNLWSLFRFLSGGDSSGTWFSRLGATPIHSSHTELEILQVRVEFGSARGSGHTQCEFRAIMETAVRDGQEVQKGIEIWYSMEVFMVQRRECGGMERRCGELAKRPFLAMPQSLIERH